MPRANKEAALEHESIRDIIKEELKKFKDEFQKELKKELKNELSDSLTNIIKTELQALRKQISAQDLEISSLKKRIETQRIEMASEKEEMMNEMTLRMQKRDYLIVSGLYEEQTGSVSERRTKDVEKIREVMKFLGNDSVTPENVMRIGKIEESRPRLVRFKCSSVEMRRHVLARSKELRRNDKFRNIYISPDMTHAQRESNRVLRNELKSRRDGGEDVRIVRNKIVTSEGNRGLSNFR